ncbi:MAG: TAXI family TRAP transporter solute-binding subunit [Alphaproteobacteria bacterium]|nr:TAXI family TRAP transporter solute-binding subunit [Alphaproteobacteria bacterium]
MSVRSAVLAAAGLCLALPAAAQVKPPAQMAWTAYDTGSSGFNMVVAIGQAFKNAYNADIRVLPGSNDIARLAPVRANRAQISAMGIGSYFAMEGIDEFGAKDWGPQKVRRLMTSLADNNIALGTAKDANIKTMADLKGKRVAWVVGAPALNRNTAAFLAFGGLTWADVKKVEFSGFGASWKGLVNGDVDTAIASTITGVSRELEASPRGMFWPPVAHADKAGWGRLNKVAPYYFPSNATAGTGGISKSSPHEGANYPYPIVVAYDTAGADVVYAVVKGMIDTYAQYKDAAPGADGFELKRQLLDWVVPYHDGTVRAFKEAGHWSDAAQKRNDDLIKRQTVLAQAWEKMAAQKGLADDAYKLAWQKTRAESLRAAGMDPIWVDWD